MSRDDLEFVSPTQAKLDTPTQLRNRYAQYKADKKYNEETLAGIRHQMFLLYANGSSQGAIAKAMGLSRGTVHAFIKRAKEEFEGVGATSQSAIPDA